MNNGDIKRGKEKVTQQLVFGFYCLYKNLSEVRQEHDCVKPLHKSQNTTMKTVR